MGKGLAPKWHIDVRPLRQMDQVGPKGSLAAEDRQPSGGQFRRPLSEGTRCTGADGTLQPLLTGRQDGWRTGLAPIRALQLIYIWAITSLIKLLFFTPILIAHITVGADKGSIRHWSRLQLRADDRLVWEVAAGWNASCIS